MMKKLKYLFIFLIITLVPTYASAHKKPDDVSFVDYAGIISDGTKNYVKSKNNILFENTQAKSQLSK